MERIDFYQAHKDDETVPLEETLGAFAKLIDEGKVGAIGASNYTAPAPEGGAGGERRNGLPRFESLQPHHNLLERGIEADLLPLCREEDLGVIPYYALASGFLSGKYRSEADLNKSPRGARSAKQYLNERGLRVLAALDEVAARFGATPAQVALAWQAAKPGITASIASATNEEQLAGLVKAAKPGTGRGGDRPTGRGKRLRTRVQRKGDRRVTPSKVASAPPLRREPVLVDLALQGGGAHGAFTWGVLDRLLEEPWLEIEAISGTSAGAMNAAVLADGHAAGGAEGARAALERFWSAVSRAALLSPCAAPRSTCCSAAGRSTSRPRSLPWTSRRGWSRPTSSTRPPPTRWPTSWPKLWTSIGSPGRRSGSSSPPPTSAPARRRIFENASITSDVLLASACLPFLFQAVEIDGEAYWDGGYSGNPTITPLVRDCASDDTILVQINPVERPGVPRTAREINNRVNEVSFNATLLKELKMIALLREVAEPRRLRGRALGKDARPPDRLRRDGGARLFVQTQRRVGLPDLPPRRGPAGGGGVPGSPRARSRPALDPRPRSGAEARGGLTLSLRG